MTLSFGQYLEESRNTHLDHLEENLFVSFEEAIRIPEFLERVLDKLSGNTNSPVDITVKVDGAPALFCGVNPENKKFFVATKSIFNVDPKINYTEQDIDRNHQGGLADTLKVALKYLPKLGIKGVLQGDILFTDSIKRRVKIDGKTYIAYKPNTITYAVPVDSDMGKKVSAAKIGIAFHTEYKGKTISDMKASFNINISSLKKTKDVWFQDVYFRDVSGSIYYTPQESNKLKRTIQKIQKSIQSSKSVIEFCSKEGFTPLIKIYLNSLVRVGKIQPTGEGFLSFLEERLKKETEKLKTSTAREKKELSHRQRTSLLKSNLAKLNSLFSSYGAIHDVKMELVRKLESIHDSNSFIEQGGEFKVTAPEGFVAIDRIGGNVVKFVDRLTFSRMNFNMIKDWK